MQFVTVDYVIVLIIVEEIEQLLCCVGLVKMQLITDKRLQVNRGKQIKMYRVWIQAKFIKPLDNSN